MPSVLSLSPRTNTQHTRSPSEPQVISPGHHTATDPKHTHTHKKFRTVLGLSAISHFTPHPSPPTSPVSVTSFESSGTFTRSNKRKIRQGSSSGGGITETSFYEPVRPSQDLDSIVIEEMTVDLGVEPVKVGQPRGVPQPVRMDTQDGPWSLSVAENPHDAHSFSIYVKTPTHNRTLTRQASEIGALHTKLRELFPNLKLPALPEDIESSRSQKRRSSFLHTLSRFTSPRTQPSHLPSPVNSPKRDASNNAAASPSTSTPTQSATSLPALAAYLTTLSNDQLVRASRPWKRFVKVRTDDLESVRVERAIKRVRSDLGMHMTSLGQSLQSLAHPSVPTSASTDVVNMTATPSESSVPSSSMANGITEEDETERSDAANMADSTIAPSVPSTEATASTPPPESESMTASTLTTASDPMSTSISQQTEDTKPTSISSPSSSMTSALKESVQGDETETEPIADQDSIQENDEDATTVPSPRTPHPASRIPRSASADPDKATRLSRVWKSSPLNPNSSQTDVENDGNETDVGPSRKSRSVSRRPRQSQRKVVLDDFEMMRVLGKGCAGKVLLVRHRATSSLYALKAITKRHVLAHQELQHTLTEQAVLKRMARQDKDPFVVKLWWSFHDKENLFLVMDFHPGGDLATQLARWGRLGRDRARFYAAEIVEGVEGLHAAGVIYRDLKPENILIGGDGHIVLTDFGLSKEFPRQNARDTANSARGLTTAPSTPNGRSSSQTEFFNDGTLTPPWMGSDRDEFFNGSGWRQRDMTSTFCGTAEYLAPEVIQGLPYSYEVDWWSFGTMLYEMLSGITPFWANNHSDMYVRVLQDDLQFPEDRAMDQDTKSLLRGLLQRNPAIRMCEPRIKKHPYFSMIDWSHVYYKRYIPPYIPPIDPTNASDTQNFDEAFLDMDPTIDNEPDEAEDSERDRTEDEERIEEESASARKSPAPIPVEDDKDVFDGYSFKGRHSVLIDDEEDDGYEGPDEDEEIEEARQATNVIHEVDIDRSVPAEGPAVDESETSPASRTPEPSTPKDIAHTKPLPESPIITVEIEEPGTPTAPPEPLEGPETPVTRRSPTPTETPVAPVVEALPPPPAAEATKPVRSKREKAPHTAADRQSKAMIDSDEDDWDFVETPGGQEINGTRGANLFARGVVDKYRLAVFRKSSQPQHPSRASRSSTTPASNKDFDPTGSPSPGSAKSRGRSTGLSLRKTKQFLRAKSPPATFSGRSSANSRRNLGQSASATVSASSTGLLTPSPSNPAQKPPTAYSLKSKSSAVSRTSLGSPGSSDNSINGDPLSLSQTALDMKSSQHKLTPGTSDPSKRSQHSDDADKRMNLKKMKNNAEKMFSIFGSPRQTS